MTTAEMVTYAYDQIDQARAELNAVSQDDSDSQPLAIDMDLADEGICDR